jgi:hypothetical protein
MKPRGLVLLSVMAAVLSTSAILAAAQDAAKPPKGVALKKLKKFDLKFNKMMNNAIRKRKPISVAESAPANQMLKMTAFISTKAFKSFVEESAEAFRKKGTELVTLDRADQQELRDRVNRWLDDIYIGKVPDDQIRALKRNRSGDFFSEKIHP